MERIVAAAKKEGTLTIYTLSRRGPAGADRAFEAKYDVKVNIWRSGTDKVLQRTLAEASAGKYDVDVIHFGSRKWKRSRARRSCRR